MFFNPVKVIQSNNWEKVCKKSQKELNIQKPLVITSKGTLERLRLKLIFKDCLIFSDISPNPTIDSCDKILKFIAKNKKNNGLIAVGGGSVMDTAKVVMAALSSNIYEIKKLLSSYETYKPTIKSIFIPTTHGTGSEVTMWGTIFDKAKKKKYSISHVTLYPSIAILDGGLSKSLPLDISIITVLDALSHSFEAIWNKNKNMISTSLAIQAICLILENIEKLKLKPDNSVLRNKILKASNIAGLSFSNTKTGAAHSISYPLTLFYGIPHGLASSIALLPLLRLNQEMIANELEEIFNNLKINNLEELEDILLQVSEDVIPYSLRKWGVKEEDLGMIAEESFSNDRIYNNIIPLNKNDVHQILKDIF